MPGHHPTNCMNSKMMAQTGSGKDRINLVFMSSAAVLQYIIIRYEAVHNPAGRLYITKLGIGNSNAKLRMELTCDANPKASEILKTKMLWGR